VKFVASWALLLCVVASLAGIVVVRRGAASGDFAQANVLTFLLAVAAVLALVAWVLSRSRWALMRRLLAVGVIVLIVCTPLLTLRFEGYSGRLVPIVRWRWSTRAEPLTQVPAVAGDVTAADITTTTADDVPQFLGPERVPDLPHIQLARDWDLHPPQQLWRRPIGAGWSGFSVVNGYAVTMEQRGPQEMVTCYDTRNGQIMWATGHDARHETVMGGVGPRGTPMIDEGHVYALGATGVLQCLEGATGTLVWSEDILRRWGITPAEDQKSVGWGRAGSPLVVGKLVIVPFGGPPGGPFHSLAAYDKRNGELLWQGGDRQVSYASPTWTTLCGIEQVVIVNEDCVSGHRWEDGSTLWTYPWEGRSTQNASCSQAVPLPGDRVLLSKGYGGGAELIHLVRADDGLLSGQRLWAERRVLKTKFTNVVVRDSFAYGLSDGILECVELESGTRQWKDRRGDFGHGQILGAGDVILVQAEDGEIVMVDMNPHELVVLGRLAALSERTWNTLCLSGDLLLARNASEAVCYRLARRGAESTAK
jgi:outer membrane protein assembly factor BamB